MTRRSFHEEHAKKSPWLNARKKPERVIKSPYPQVTVETECSEKHGEEGTYCFTVTLNAQIVNDFPQNKVWATIECPRCGAIKSGFYPVE